MRLSVFNCSPRGLHSTSKIMMDQLVSGFLSNSGNHVEAHYLSGNGNNLQDYVDAFNNGETILVAYPLYIDAMPAFSLKIFEALEPYCNLNKKRSIGFLVQYGYPESTHVQAVKRFNEKLAKRLNCHYLGTISRGYCNRIERSPATQKDPIFEQLHELGRQLGKHGRFDTNDLEKFAGIETLPKSIQLKVNLLYGFPTNKSFLVRELWAHKTWGKRNAAPYVK